MLPNIVPPSGMPGVSDGQLRSICRPAPLGMDEETGAWTGRLVPIFGRRSRAQSKWIPLGAMRVAPGTDVPEAIEFLFQGIDPVTGFVETTAQSVDPQAPILSGVIAAPMTLPYVAADGVTLVLDVTTLAGPNDLYRRNASLLELFELEVDDGSTTTFEIVQAVTDELAGELRLTVAPLNAGATDLSDFGPGDLFDLVPRFFGIRTSGVKDFLPDSATVRIRFQAAPETALGAPDEANATPLTSDITELTNPMLPFSPLNNTDYRFFRFVVDFDIAAIGDLSFSSPRPSLEFLRVPIRF